MPELHKLLPEVIAIAKDAGAKIMDIYETEFDVTQKQDNSPLTAADMAAHRAIVAGLKRLTPELPVLSEESASVPFSERSTWNRYWLVDPLDGTREFIKRNGEFTVNIALIDRSEPVIGVIYTPVTQLCFYAARGLGAFKTNHDNKPQRLQTQKKSGDVVKVAGSRSHRGDSLNSFLEKIGPHEMLSMGSSLKFCLVAEGKVDIYPRLGPTSEWDTAAAQCIVEEAGGEVVNMQRQSMRYNTKESLLNPNFLVIADRAYNWMPYFE